MYGVDVRLELPQVLLAGRSEKLVAPLLTRCSLYQRLLRQFMYLCTSKASKVSKSV